MRHEAQRHGVDAVPQIPRRRAVIEHMSQVRSTSGAPDLGLADTEEIRWRLDHVLFRNRPGEARPSGAGGVLGFRIEDRRAAANAAVDAILIEPVVRPRTGELSVFPTLDRLRI